MTNTVNAKITRDKAKLSRSIASTAKKYKSIKKAMDDDACSSFIRATEHACPSMLNKMFDWMTDNYKHAFRMWLGVLSQYETEDGKTRNWLGYRAKEKDGKPAGFFITKGAKDAREKCAAKYQGKDEIEFVPFYDAGDKERKPEEMSLNVLLAMLTATTQRVKSKATKEQIDLPASLTTEMDKLDTLAGRLRSDETETEKHNSEEKNEEPPVKLLTHDKEPKKERVTAVG